MRLKRVRINDFRSIKDLELELEPGCRILVGANGSGKSNILRAMALLSEEYKTSPADVRMLLPNETVKPGAVVRFFFGFDDSEMQYLYDSVRSRICSRSEDLPLVKTAAKDITLREFCQFHREGVFRVDVGARARGPRHLSLPPGYTLLPNWKKPAEGCPPNTTIKMKDGEAVRIGSVRLINVNDCAAVPQGIFADASSEDLNDIVGREVTELISALVRGALVWRFDESHPLPSRVDLASFSANPDSCEPLRNMFVLAGIENIRQEIESAQSGSKHGLKNLLARVAQAASKRLFEIWKEAEGIEFTLTPDGTGIDIGVRDSANEFEPSQRGDGFQRFVAFFLTVAARIQAGNVKHSLLLLDDPEAGLHPTAARQLRNALIALSAQIPVVYCTHSPFMVDGESVSRHLIVRRSGEITTAQTARDEVVVDEEVLFSAMGYSIYESLKGVNVIFNGWRDRRLFSVAMRKLPPAHRALQDIFAKIGICHAAGFKTHQYVSSVLELAQRHCVIVSDQDTQARENQRQYERHTGYGHWLRYDQVLRGISAITAEDFVRLNALTPVIHDVMQRYPKLRPLADTELVCPPGKLAAVDSWLRSGGFPDVERKALLEEIRDRVFRNLTVTQVDDSYYQFLSRLAILINDGKHDM